ncbi:Pyranose dehydrogenase 1-like protein 3 [Colletotrichum truncatum]|uniref:Pyranose dehydrogenase 1-like protein 3 n=1 Tax=Colletotrichum truncatum TaxID=5467 RepID=A0ACC3ZCB2_COLTU|nr:Pyranose dehydrogenase 1-like protein 3 [Colletotrichum truncatum]KAF6797714.1 Pyranose dehydrogenase 1-like protein 3 [Colletotrichum truncatum]
MLTFNYPSATNSMPLFKMTKTSSTATLVAWLVLGAAGAMALSIPQSIAHTKVLARAEDVKAEYDYVIVGGGTAGLTVADRLTENGKHTVLVIELGIFDNSTSVNTVAGGAAAFADPSHLFGFASVPQEGLNGRNFTVFGGVMLGGSSGVNGMQVHRGQKDDYNRWGSYFSDSSEWSWEGLLPYFKKAWNFHPPTPELTEPFDIKYDESFWGDSSDVHASFPTFQYPMLKTEVAAFGEIEGVKHPEDSGAGEPGVFWYPMSADPSTMTRSMSRNGHWDDIEAVRDNYETVTGQKVLRVLFDGQTATGVSFVQANATSAERAQTVKAKKEVVIAAGTIHTPQILQRSGIGGKTLLEAANIDVVVDLPGVGHNFQDHPLGAGATFSFTNFDVHPDPTDLQTNQTFIDEAKAEFEAKRTGPLTIASGNAACFLPFPVVAPASFEKIASAYESQDPGAYLPERTDATVIAGYAAQQKALAAAMRSNGSAFYNHFLRGADIEGAFVTLHPLSRGTIEIDPTDPFFKEPIVDYRALSNPADLDVQVEFIRFARKYFLETSLAEFKPVELVPGANVTSFEALSNALRSQLSPTTFHPIGTAAMLPRELGGVVDEKLLVYGVEGLSVVDASVQPDLPGAYTQQTVYAVAEKAADLIKARACKVSRRGLITTTTGKR